MLCGLVIVTDVVGRGGAEQNLPLRFENNKEKNHQKIILPYGYVPMYLIKVVTKSSSRRCCLELADKPICLLGTWIVQPILF